MHANHPLETRPPVRVATALLVAAMAFMAGCATSPPTRFYTLTALAPHTTTPPPPSSQRRPIVGIGPVDVSAYLDRSQIVLREGETRLKLADFDQWAEPLARSVARVLAENLHARLPDMHPIVQPWSDLRSDYQVAVKILRFDGDLTGNVRLRASWAVADGASHRYLAVRDSDISAKARGAGYEAIARAMSEALDQLGSQIASILRRLDEDRES